jgi:hypothetical protein
MRALRGVLGALLWIVGGLLGLVAVVLCVTVILMPLGLPLLRLSRKMVGTAVRLMMPRPLAHPVKEAERSGRKLGRKAKGQAPAVDLDTKKLRKKAKQRGRKLRKKVA